MSSPSSSYGLETDNVLKIIDKINCSTIKIVSLIGGEPLMRKDFSLIINSFSKDIELKLDSNGSLIKSRWNHGVKNIKYFNIGLDGMPNSNEIERNYTNRVIDTIKFLLDNDKIVNIPFIVTGQNWRSFSQNLDFVLSLNPNKVQINIYGDVLLSKKNDCNHLPVDKQTIVLKILKEKLEKNPELNKIITLGGWKNDYFFENFAPNKSPCLCGIYRAALSYDGLLLPCPVLANYTSSLFQNDTLKSEYSLVKNDISSILNKDLFLIYKDNIFNVPQQCNNCKYKNSCNNGCRSFNLLIEGTLPGKIAKNCFV